MRVFKRSVELRLEWGGVGVCVCVSSVVLIKSAVDAFLSMLGYV